MKKKFVVMDITLFLCSSNNDKRKDNELFRYWTIVSFRIPYHYDSGGVSGGGHCSCRTSWMYLPENEGHSAA